jgi:hypothetical protein
MGWYFKFTLNASWGWGYNNSGNNIVAMLPAGGPAALPAPHTPGRFVSPAKFRYSWNTCTFGYSFPFYRVSDWQGEVDRIALWGINAPLLLLQMSLLGSGHGTSSLIGNLYARGALEGRPGCGRGTHALRETFKDLWELLLGQIKAAWDACRLSPQVLLRLLPTHVVIIVCEAAKGVHLALTIGASLGSTLNRAACHWYPGDVSRREGDVVVCSPDAPGLLQPAALIEARIARQTYTGWLLASVGVARRKEAAAVALLAWMDHAAAGNLQLFRVLVRYLVLAVDAARTGLRGTQLWLVECRVLVPLDDIVRHSRGIQLTEWKTGYGYSPYWVRGRSIF